MADTIYILEDEEDIALLIKFNLEKEGFRVTSFLHPSDFLQSYKEKDFALLILDLMLPDMSGLEILKLLRQDKTKKGLPIIVLTAKNSEFDKVLGLELGADDYITKPFGINELIARVKAVLRRVKNDDSGEKEILTFDKIKIFLSSFQVYIDNTRVELTKTEFLLLKLFISRKGTVLSRETLLEYLWGNEKTVIDRTIDVHIKKLRDKLGKYGDYIKTVRGVGYIFEGNN